MLCCSSFWLAAQDYSILTLNRDLVPGADAIVRNELKEITILSPGEAIIKHTHAITILNDKGDDYAGYYDYYNQFFTIEDIEGRLFDMTGKELKKVRKKDITDLSSESGNSVSDTRYKTHNFHHKEYPYTVEYTSVINVKGLFYLPGWIPQFNNTLAVEKSRMLVKTPGSYKLRYKAYNFKGIEKITPHGAYTEYNWEVSNLKALVSEPLMPSWSRVRAYVAIAPSEFEIKGIRANMDTWKNFGSFIYRLTEGRDALPADMAQKVKILTAGLNDPKEKIRVLYEYLQKNTRYISIQLGIGGWQTIPAAEVARNGYGDCKALSNYMAAMLREVGIGSRYTIIQAGPGGLFTDVDFVHNQFDHAILCVPLAKDTVWLECTSNTLPAGYLGDFTGNRYALIVDENGGTMVRTPTYKKEQNRQDRFVKATVNPDGLTNVKAVTKYTGLQQDDLQGFTATASKDKVLKMLRSRFDLPTYEVGNFSYKEKPGQNPLLEEELEINVEGYAQITGKRLFLVPNLLTQSGRKYNADTARKFEVYLSYDYIDTDTVVIDLPAGYEPENIPKPVEIKSKFGEYSSKTTVEKQQLIYVRSVSQNSGLYPPAAFEELRQYYLSIQKADRAKVVLVKKDDQAVAASANQ